MYSASSTVDEVCPGQPVYVQSERNSGLGFLNLTIAEVSIKTMLPVGNYNYTIAVDGGRLNCVVNVQVIGELL